MNFEDLQLNSQLLKTVKESGFDSPTPIQERCIPEILKGKDILGQSSTGSGKTAAFGLPVLQLMQNGGKGVQCLILTPTRELCVQVNDSMNLFGKHMHIRSFPVFGGVGYNPQVNALKASDIIVGTPGRILDHLKQGTANFRNVKFLILDEADKMAEMGFIDDVNEIIRNVSKERQTLLFSATLPLSVGSIVKKYMNLPIRISVSEYVDKGHLRQVYYDVRNHEKFSLLYHLISTKTSGMSMVFCATRRTVDAIAKNLKMNGIHALAIHGGHTQNRRLDTINALKDQKIDVLVATDVAARGLDIKNVTYVYNYDVPKTSDEYIHRIGRTARAGNEGDAITLVSENDYDNFSSVLRSPAIEIKKAEAEKFESVKFNTGSGDRRQSSGRGGFRGSSGSRNSGGRRGDFRGKPGQGRSSGPRRSSNGRSGRTERTGGKYKFMS